MGALRKLCLGAAGLALILFGAGLVAGRADVWQPAALVATIGLALGLGAWPALRGYQFTGWIIVAVAAGMIYPAAFAQWGRLDLRNKWVILLVVQTVMFGMGTQMSLRDFAGVARSPRGVLVGIVCHFSVMPLVGFGLTRIFRFPPEIAAGIILIGSCSSGLASNVMAYLARANLPLSVTVTAVTTMVAPFLTPLWMKLLAGRLVAVSFFAMMMEIVEIVIVPIGAALLHDYLKHASPRGRRRVLGAAGLGGAWLGFLALGGWNRLQGALPAPALTAVGVSGFFAGAIIFGAAYHELAARRPAARPAHARGVDGGHRLLHHGDDRGRARSPAAGGRRCFSWPRRCTMRRGTFSATGSAAAPGWTGIPPARWRLRSASRTAAWPRGWPAPWANSPPSAWPRRFSVRG